MTTIKINNRPKWLILFFSSKNNCPKRPGIYIIIPSEERFDRLISYRYQPLPLNSHGCSRADTLRLLKSLQNIERLFRDRKFLREDSILIFDFLTTLVEKAREISEGKLMALLPDLLTNNAGEKYNAPDNGPCSENTGEIVHCTALTAYVRYQAGHNQGTRRL